jgi:hypothetical protein
MKRFIAMILAVSMLLCGSVAFAALPETDGTQASNYFASYGMAVTAIGSGRLQLSFTCSAVGLADQLGVANYQVQKKNSSVEWVDITGFLSGSTKTNTTSHSCSKIFYGVAGETYRVRCTFICVKGGSSETKSYTSIKKKAT